MAHQRGTLQRKLSSLIQDFKHTRDSWEEINSHTVTTANALTNAVLQSKCVL
jgi:gamma-glutamyl-gamma-aminobutyrate hydrolase PuuD